MISETPSRILYTFAILGNSFVLAVFLYFLIKQYISNTSDSTASFSTHFYNCKSVAKKFSLTVQGTDDGYWTGSEGFQDSLAVYTIGLTDIAATSDAEFTSLINQAFKENVITKVSQLSKNMPLSLNLLYWCNFYYSTTIDGMFFGLEFTGLSLSLFDTRYRSIGIGNANQNCIDNSAWTWNIILGTLIVSWNVTAFTDTCANVVSPSLLGYYEKYDTVSFEIVIDAAACMDVMAANMELVPLDGLLVNIRHYRLFHYNGVSYSVDLKVCKVTTQTLTQTLLLHTHTVGRFKDMFSLFVCLFAG